MKFRTQTPLLRLCLSIPLSISLTPVLVYLIGRAFTVAAVLPFYALLAITFLGLLTLPGARPRPGHWPAGARKTAGYLSAIWAVLATFTLVDLQLGNRLYYSVVAYDYTVRSAAVSALARTASYPPSNPFFFTGQPSPFRYHYFWFLLCSLPDRLLLCLGNGAIIQPRQALIAGVIIVGLALLCVVALYLRFFCPDGARNVRRRTLIAAALLSVSGLDILFSLARIAERILFHRGHLYPTVDWWNPEEVTGWLDTALWVPHHLAGLLACLMGFLILWNNGIGNSVRRRWQDVFAAALAFASASGLSVYVTLVCAIFLSVWCLVLLIRKRWQDLVTFAATGAATALLAFPLIMELSRAGVAGTAQGEQSSFVRFGVRNFNPVIILFDRIYGGHTAALLPIYNLIFLPLNYFLEMGAFFVIGVFTVHRWRTTKHPLSWPALAGAVALVTALAACTFLRSNTIVNNDLGMRGILIAQFVLLIWAAEWLATIPFRHAGWLLTATLALGVATNVYEVATLRFFTGLASTRFYPGGNIFFSRGFDLGRFSFDNREAYEWLDRHAPLTAVEQHYTNGEGDLAPGLYSNRQMAQLDMATAIAFGANPAQSKEVETAIRSVFGESGANPYHLCRLIPIDYLIARNVNAAWKDSSSWIWREKPIFQNRSVRVFRCPAPATH
ncbi:MAG: hypothetical protein M3Z09_04695 [Acidobacteriota bacterium]|nr:hypothetical protein [Acidobacteriota bacterium]